MFKGKTAVVTGGASGIGLGTAKRLSVEGACVAILDVNDEGGSEVARDVGGIYVNCDVADASHMDVAFDAVERELGKIDIAFLNAGVPTGESDITRVTNEQYRRIMGVNVDGVVFGVRASVRAMERNGGGAIVCTSSLGGFLPYGGDSIYALTKHAVIGLVRSLGAPLEPKKITINAICPGLVETALTQPLVARLKEANFPLMQPADIAEAVVRAIIDGDTGQAYVCQPGREPVRFKFGGVPGPRSAGARGKRPPSGIGVG